jgi:hypothetical protein
LSVALPSGIEQAFQLAAGELGFCSAAWLFVREVAAEGGDLLVSELRDHLGRAFPVLDAVCSAWAAGSRAPDTDPADVVAACAGAGRVVVVGLETAFLDPLVARCDGVRLALLCHSAFDVDWDRALANYEGRIEPVDLDSFQAWAGPTSALLTFAYGLHGASVHVLPAWLRVIGEDVRTQFRSLIAWDVLREAMYVYPRWLVEVPASSFTHIR